MPDTTMQECDLCKVTQEALTPFNPETLCPYHRNQYEYALAQHVLEATADGVKWSTS